MGPFARLRAAMRVSLPQDLRQAVTAEGVLLLAERLPCTVTLRGYKAPGRRSALSKTPTSGAIAITSSRVVVRTGTYEDVDLERDRWHALEVAKDGTDRVSLAYDPAIFHADRSGRVEIRLTTPEAGRVVQLLAGG